MPNKEREGVREMKKGSKKSLCIASGLFLAFVLWTVLVCFFEVEAIGPRGSTVGFAGLNECVHRLTGVHLGLYNVTDWLGLVPIGFAVGFAVLGLVQWIKRKRIWRVDRDLLALGGFYLVVIAAYLLFEAYAVNYRPILINGYLEPSYPSSTTLLVICVMSTAMMQLNFRIKNKIFRRLTLWTIAAFVAFMMIGRLLAGVHWVTDIIGGLLLGGGIVTAYDAVYRILEGK